MNNYLYIISLRYCPFCINTRRLLEENNIKHHDNIIKDEEKFKYKTQEISTFPQIYYVKNKLEKKVLIGGNSDLEDIIELNNSIKDDKNKQMDQLITNFLSTHPKINKKILLKVLYLINKKDMSNLTGGSYSKILKGGYDQNLFTAYSASQITPELFKNFLGKAIIFIRGKKKKGFFSSYNNKMEIYEILEFNINRDNKINIKTNLVQWECHDLYCTMKRRSGIILTPELIQEKFVDIEFTQFLVTKDNYKIVEKQQQNLTKLKTGDIIPLLSKYGDYQGQYLVSDEDVDGDIQNKYFFYVVSITNSNIVPLVESNKNLEKIAEISKPIQLIKSEETKNTQIENSLKKEQKIDLEKSTYQINSFGFEIGHRVDTYPINENKSYDLGSKNVGFFKNLVESTTDGNWIILEKST